MEMFGKDSIVFRVFTVIRDANNALFPFELFVILHGMKEATIRYALCRLVEENMIVKTDNFVKTPNGGLAVLYGINQVMISKRIIQLEQQQKENPEGFTHGQLRSAIVNLLKECETGLTPSEVAERLGSVRQHSVANTLVKLFRLGLVYRSPFFIPNRIEGVTGNMSVVYGANMEKVLHGISRLMPPTVRASLIQIRSSDRIWPGWELIKRTKIDNYNLIQWFKQGLCTMGLVKYKTAGNITYYYNPQLPDDIVERQLAQLKEESRQWRLNITELGRMFQKRAVFVYVEYLRSKGYDIKTVDNFPEFIPSWLSPQTRKKYQVIKTDENGHTWTEYTNDVWKFDSEPVDCVIFVRDRNVDDKTVHVLTCKRDISKR